MLEPGTVPIADALNALHGEEPGPPEEWIRRLGALPLVYQPGERWMYHTTADVTGVLIARATGMSFGDALRERICEPLGMKDTAFSVGGESISRLATAYQRDDITGEAVSGLTPGYFDDIGWGFGMSVRTRRTHPGPPPGVSYPWAASVGSYGWPGVYGTGWYNDPAEDMTTILMIQRAPAPPSLPILLDFWTAAYQAIDD